MKSKTVSEVIDTLNDEQRQMLYILVGHAVQTDRHYIVGNGDFDNSEQRRLRKLYNKLNKEQKITVTYLINEAMRTDRKEKNK